MTAIRISSKFQKVLIITLCWTVFQLLTYTNTYFLIADLLNMGKLHGYYAFWPDFIGNLVLGIFGGLIGGYVLVYKVNSGFRQRTFLSGILKSGAYFILLYISGAICILFLMTFIFYTIREGIAPAVTRSWTNLLVNLGTPSFAIAMLGWVLVVSGTQFMLQVNDKFGQGVLWKFLTGKYYQPRIEERIFMFLDLKSSTTIAEQLGHQRFFGLLRDLYQDITAPVIRNHGEIYQYVGDEVVITWPLERGLKNNSCLHCFFDIKKTVAGRNLFYQKKYQVTPEFKAGLHLGEATVGEIGVIKKDIVYSGDVLNTASRIQGECNRYGVDLLVSQDLLTRLNDDLSYHIVPIGEIELRGKMEKIEISSAVG